MADTKITALTALTAADPANDVLPIVDVSDTTMAASGTTKKISVNNILGCSGTATLASATISGDLTVDTSTLKVDSANNRVGIGTASPGYPLHVSASDSEIVIQDSNTPVGSNPASLLSFWGSASRAGYIGYPSDNNLYINQISNNSILFLTNNTEQMRLNSTGLGVGRSPSYRLQASSGTKATTASLATVAGITTTDADDFGIYFRLKTDATGANRYAAITSFDNGSGNGARDLVLQDLGGNVGIGVTPSAWVLGKVLEVGQLGNALWSPGAGDFRVMNNSFYGSGPAYKYAANGFATMYQTQNGQHQFHTAPSGTAGNAITFTQAMTLDASGNLLVNTTSQILSAKVSLQTAGTRGYSYNDTTGGAGTKAIIFGSLGVEVGSVSTTTLATTYNTLSDYRLKEAVQPLVGGLARVSALKPSIYKWKSNGSSGEGFIAHELADVVPAAVTGKKDAVNEDGTVNPQGVDMSRIVPILVAAIQELTARVQTLETR